MRQRLQGRKALILGVAVAAIGIAVALILVSVLGSGDGKKASPATTSSATTTATTTTTTAGTTTSEAAVPGAAEAAKLFEGIPQKLNVLGDPKAPVTMIEFADLQCPFCAQYAVDVLPTIVRRYVRPGKIKLVFAGMAFIGPDSEAALRATYAAGLQNKLWNFLDLLYRNQGAENSGWVTDGLLRQVGNSVAGLDAEQLLGARNSTEVDNALAATEQQAQSAGVNSTPTFFAGPTGGTLEHMNIASLEPGAFRPTLDKLTQGQ